MSSHLTPPRLAERLLALAVADGAWRDSILGDLREEYIVRRRTQGTGPARRWYWSQALAIGARGLLAHVRRRAGSTALLRTAEIETSVGWRAGFSRDFLHAWRTLVRRPGTSAVVIVTLALAVATNTTSFAILDALVLRPFRFPDVDRLVIIASSDPRQGFFDPSIIGRTVRLDGEPHEVVGIAPPGFAIPLGAQVWAPLAYSTEEWNNRRNRYLMAIGCLSEGASINDARAEIAAITDRLRRQYPETNATIPNAVAGFTEGMSDPGTDVFVSTMLVASLLLLLIACANIANLLLAASSERGQEFGMRLALGASRARLTCQLMIEAGLLTSLAIVLAIPLTWAWLGLTRASIPAAVIRFVPGFHSMDISPVVFWSAAAFGALATLVFALIPAWQTVRGDVVETLRHTSRSTTASRQRHWLRNMLAASQVALTLALLFGSGLMLTAADEAVDAASFGFDKHNLLVGRLVLPERPYADAERLR